MAASVAPLSPTALHCLLPADSLCDARKRCLDFTLVKGVQIIIDRGNLKKPLRTDASDCSDVLLCSELAQRNSSMRVCDRWWVEGFESAYLACKHELMINNPLVIRLDDTRRVNENGLVILDRGITLAGVLHGDLHEEACD